MEVKWSDSKNEADNQGKPSHSIEAIDINGNKREKLEDEVKMIWIWCPHIFELRYFSWEPITTHRSSKLRSVSSGTLGMGESMAWCQYHGPASLCKLWQCYETRSLVWGQTLVWPHHSNISANIVIRNFTSMWISPAIFRLKCFAPLSSIRYNCLLWNLFQIKSHPLPPPSTPWLNMTQLSAPSNCNLSLSLMQ